MIEAINSNSESSAYSVSLASSMYAAGLCHSRNLETDTSDTPPTLTLQQVRDVLHKRMNMKNPHKVWLATHLADDILKKCPDTIGPIKSDIYQVRCLGFVLFYPA